MGVMDSVFGDVRSVKLPQKVNPRLMLGYTITPTVYGHPGTQDTTDTVLVFGDARSVKPNQYLPLMLKPKLTTSSTEYGQPGTLDTTVSTDGNGVIPLANLLSNPTKKIEYQIWRKTNFSKLKKFSLFQLANFFNHETRKTSWQTAQLVIITNVMNYMHPS